MALSQITFQFEDPPGHGDEGKGISAANDNKKKKRGRKSLKEMGTEDVLSDIPPDDILFQKRYYPIGDVAVMFNENTSLIRYWEKEFDILKPKKNKKGDRFFRPEDVKNLKMIYHLLRERKYTIEGAKEFLKNDKAAGEKHEMIEALQELRLFLLELKNNL
jgi:DNA-binding transcriptional MerR regulator